MNRNKRWIGLGMAAVMMGSMAVPVLAEEGNMKLEVGYTEESTYTLTIPANVSLFEDKEATQTISLESINIGTKQTVEVRVASGIESGKVTLVDEKDKENNKHTSIVSLTSGATEGIEANAVVAEFEGTETDAKDGTGTLYFSALGNVPAGTYSGTITFTAEIKDK